MIDGQFELVETGAGGFQYQNYNPFDPSIPDMIAASNTAESVFSQNIIWNDKVRKATGMKWLPPGQVRFIEL